MADPTHGRELHREFVGMLFALAIAEVAIQAATVANSELDWRVCLPSYSHLVLATAVIAASWVGWGWSDHSLSNVRNVFTFDFVELLLDLWLVVLYFFIVKGVELPIEDANKQLAIAPSVSNESWWIFVMFVTYFVWDFISKIREHDDKGRKKRGFFKRDDKHRVVFLQRGWASFFCAVLAGTAYFAFQTIKPNSANVVWADTALLALVFLFRAMKLQSLYDLGRREVILMFVLGLIFLACLWQSSALEMILKPSLRPAGNLV